jgi:hypothetical protein
LLSSAFVGCATHRAVLPTIISSETYPIPNYPEQGVVEGKRLIVSPMHTVEGGVYFLDMGFSYTILELMDGHFRYWFSTDVLTSHPKYPVTGSYTVDDATVRLIHKGNGVEDIWTFRKINDGTTLWRPNAVKSWHEEKIFDSFGILLPTNLKPEEILAKHQL